jgi:hypothetical protein
MTDGLRGNDPGRWGHSLANLAEILVPLLDTVRATSVAEIGARAGDLTSDPLYWADGADAQVVAVDPGPQPELIELAERSIPLKLASERRWRAAELPTRRPRRASSAATAACAEAR